VDIRVSLNRPRHQNVEKRAFRDGTSPSYQHITYIQHNQHDELGTYSAQERVIRVIIYLRKPEKNLENLHS
jgi:hypothetical protein